MKKSLIWTTITVGVIGIGVPAFAAVQTNKPLPSINTVQNKVEDISGPCDEAEHASDPRCATVSVVAPQATTANTTQATPVTQPSVSVDDSTSNSIDDNSTSNSIDDNSTSNSIDDSTSNSIDDSTSNSIDDISGPCDEAEHANDPRCTGASAPADDNSGSGGGDDSGHDGSGHGDDDD